jgi:drug/metabolite transporter (DMT)-like permease
VTVELGLLLALASAVSTQVGFLLRHRGAVAAPEVSMRRPLRSAAGLFRSKWWTIGYVVAAVAYGLHVGALALAPLSVVQAVLAGGLVILGVVAERFFGFDLGRREWTGVGLTAAGLAFLALTGTGQSGDSSSHSVMTMVGFEGALVGMGMLLLVWGGRGRDRARCGILLGIAAGLLFTVTHVAVKGLTEPAEQGVLHVLLSPYLLLAIGPAIVAFFASARSLQLGDAVPVIAVTSVASNASAIPAGVVVFGDSLGSDGLTVAVRTAAFVMVIAAAALIPAPTRIAGEGPRGGTEPSVETA